MMKNKPPRMDFNSQFSILNSQLVKEQNYIPPPPRKVLADVYDHL